MMPIPDPNESSNSANADNANSAELVNEFKHEDALMTMTHVLIFLTVIGSIFLIVTIGIRQNEGVFTSRLIINWTLIGALIGSILFSIFISVFSRVICNISISLKKIASK